MAAVAKELHDGHADQDIIVQDQDGLNGRRLAVAVGHRHARILPSRRLIAVLWEGEAGKVERSCRRSLRPTLCYTMRCLRYFSSTSTEQISPDSTGPFTSFDPVESGEICSV